MRECRGAAAPTSGSVIIGAYAPPAPVCSQLPPLAAAAARLAATAARFARAASRILTLTSIASRRGPWLLCCFCSTQRPESGARSSHGILYEVKTSLSV
jgi:hypothetical protein